MSTCEIQDCGLEASGKYNGVETCEHCRQEFVSVGAGVVYFNGRWHGVIGAKYSQDLLRVFPGIVSGALPRVGVK